MLVLPNLYQLKGAPVPTLRRLLPLLALVLALAAAGCSSATNTGDPSTAATVNGNDIAVSDVEDQVELASANNPGEDPDPEQVEALQAEVVQYLVRLELLEQGAADLGIEFTDDDLQEARDDLAQQFGGEEQLEEQLEEQGMDLADLDVQLRSQALEERINEALADDIEIDDEDVRSAYEEQYGGDNPVVRHILLETEEEAEEVIEELEGGADFNELAVERSTDPSAQTNEGELGPLPPGQTVPEFEEAVMGAEPGELVGPVESEFGFHVIEVVDPPELEEVEDEIREQVMAQQGQQEAFLEWIRGIAVDAEVDVNPRFGQWDAEEIAVVPASALDEDGEAAPEGDAPEGDASQDEG